MRQARDMLFGQLALLLMPRELQRCASASLYGKRGDEGLSEVCVRRKAAWRLRRAPWLFSVKAVPLEHCPQRAQLCGLGYIQGSRAFLTSIHPKSFLPLIAWPVIQWESQLPTRHRGRLLRCVPAYE